MDPRMADASTHVVDACGRRFICGRERQRCNTLHRFLVLVFRERHQQRRSFPFRSKLLRAPSSLSPTPLVSPPLLSALSPVIAAPLLRHRRVGSTCLAELASRTDGMVSLRVSPALRGTCLFFFVFFSFIVFLLFFMTFHLFLKDFRHMTHTRHTLVLSRRLMQLLL